MCRGIYENIPRPVINHQNDILERFLQFEFETKEFFKINIKPKAVLFNRGRIDHRKWIRHYCNILQAHRV